jgi:hypothetical protein
MAEEGYCTEETQSRPLTHRQIQQAQNAVEDMKVKHKRAWTKEEIREVIWCYKIYARNKMADVEGSGTCSSHVLVNSEGDNDVTMCKM